MERPASIVGSEGSGPTGLRGSRCALVPERSNSRFSSSNPREANPAFKTRKPKQRKRLLEATRTTEKGFVAIGEDVGFHPLFYGPVYSLPVRVIMWFFLGFGGPLWGGVIVHLISKRTRIPRLVYIGLLTGAVAIEVLLPFVQEAYHHF
jgi:hypothetical protein